MTLAEARAIGNRYGLTVSALEPLREGSVNSNFRLTVASGERFFMRVYEEQASEGAAAELAMIQELAGLGVPTPAPLPERGGGFAAEHAGKPVGIHPWTDGEILCTGRVTPERTFALGRALARVHCCTPSVSKIPAGRFKTSDLYVRLDAIDGQDRSYVDDTRFIRERLLRYSERLSPDLTRGLIHGDLFRDNVLWRGDELVALLDFESASNGFFVYDLMVCVHAWCFRDVFQLDLVRALFDGYVSVRALGREEQLALPSVGALAALRFATTRITDFSLRCRAGERPVRDYRRFLARLEALEGGVLDPIIKEGMS
jgi:homoserine kinase type II